MYLNPEVTAFEEAIHSPIYIDKTEMITFLNTLVHTKQKYVSVSRPRRFGKTMAADMISAYYCREVCERPLFEKLKIAAKEGLSLSWDAYLGKFNVIRLVMTDFIKRNKTVAESLSLLSKRLLGELKETCPEMEPDEDDFIFSFEKFYQKTKIPFVIIIDEWDAIFRIRKEDRDGQREYLDFLRDWLKDKNSVALAYMTGILPIKKYGQHSALNMFSEYAMTHQKQLASYTGFTEREVKELCQAYNMSYDEISDWYDGYLVSEDIPIDKRDSYRRKEYTDQAFSIYNPLSVVEAMLSGEIRNYWNRTETYEALADYIRMDFDGMKSEVALMMDGGRVKVDISKYQNDMTTFYNKDDVLTLLVHLGYLSYDAEAGEVFIPNREILDEFRISTDTEDWNPVFKALRESDELLKATWAMDEEKVARLLERAHDQAGNQTYNSEAALSYGVQLAYYAARKYYTSILEVDSGKGFIDIAYLPSPRYPDKPLLLIELKYEKDADTAINQILKQNYPDKLAHYKGNMLLIGVSYNKDVKNTSSDFKHHTCKIVKT